LDDEEIAALREAFRRSQEVSNSHQPAPQTVAALVKSRDSSCTGGYHCSAYSSPSNGGSPGEVTENDDGL
jgi:hypothetical protein